MEDLYKLKEMGCSGALVATAVHRKRIPVDIIQKGKV